MTSRCPSDLALESYLLDRQGAKAAPHVGSCAECQARIARMEQEGKDFLRYVFPATVAKVEEAARQRRPSWTRWVLLLPVPAAAAVAALLLVQPGHAPESLGPPSDDAVQIKGGGGLGLTVFLGAAEGAKALGEGEAVPAAAELRFKIQPTRACRLWVVSVDATGEVSRLYPATGEGGAEIAKGGPLPGGAVLDGRGGPERIFAVCSSAPLAYGDLKAAIQRAVSRGEQAVRANRVIPGLPDNTVQATVLIEKR
jgi:hypothetical protein